MDHKVALHMKMQMDYTLYKLYDEQSLSALREVSRYEDSHGFDIEGWDDTDAYEKAYIEFTKTDEGFKKLWHEWNEVHDVTMKHLKALCNAVTEFTDGKIDYDTAFRMVTNPRYQDRFETAILGKE